MENTAQWVGIDVSKATLDIYIRPMGKAMKPQVLAIESELARQLSELISRRRQLVEMQTALENRRARARGKALADIEAHLDYLDQR
jgi:transposase